jgi:hypothetical protein
MVVRATTSTTAAVPFGIVDVYSGAAAAYSVRKLRGAYTGAAIRVRRSNDNAEQDIGFTAIGDLDETALSTFVGINSGFITTLYDQSGNGRNVNQATAANQPRIVNAGVIDKINGIPSARFSLQFLTSAANIPSPSGGLATLISVLPSVTGGYRGISLFATLSENEYVRFSVNGFSYPFLGRTLRTETVNAGMPASGGLVFSHINNGSNHLLYRNKVLGATAALSGAVETSATCSIRIGANFISDGNYISENILFPRVLSLQEKLTIEDNMMSYYGIT